MPTPVEIFRQTIEHFVAEFIHNPYLCYTEHGLHARFYAQLYHALAPDQRYLTWQGQRVCAVQKEYPTVVDIAGRRTYTEIYEFRKLTRNVIQSDFIE